MDFAIARSFVGMHARIALPRLRDTVRNWRPDLIVRESGEFAGFVAGLGLDLPLISDALQAFKFDAGAITVGDRAANG